jgi:hypothetical protein
MARRYGIAVIAEQLQQPDHAANDPLVPRDTPGPA